MAKAGITIGLRAYQHRDPVTGTTKIFLRNAHSRQSSPRLKNFQRCVADAQRGYHPSGSTPAERSANLRAHLAQAAKACAGGRGMR